MRVTQRFCLGYPTSSGRVVTLFVGVSESNSRLCPPLGQCLHEVGKSLPPQTEPCLWRVYVGRAHHVYGMCMGVGFTCLWRVYVGGAHMFMACVCGWGSHVYGVYVGRAHMFMACVCGWGLTLTSSLWLLRWNPLRTWNLHWWPWWQPGCVLSILLSGLPRTDHFQSPWQRSAQTGLSPTFLERQRTRVTKVERMQNFFLQRKHLGIISS